MLSRKPQFRPFARVLTALAGIVLLLAGEAPLIAFSAQAAAMDSCPDGHACCRRMHHGTQHSGAGWQGDVCGMPGCGGGALAAVSIQTLAAAVHAVPFQLNLATELAALLTIFCIVAAQYTPERFQRPPPSFL